MCGAQYRAWIRKTLNQNTMQYSVQSLATTRKLLMRCYQPWALILDADCMEDVVGYLGNLASVQFDNVIDDRTPQIGRAHV